MSEFDNKMKIIARISCDYTDKFGIPRQSGLVGGLESKIVFESEFRDPNALRGIEQWSHLWLIWQFSEAIRDKWSPTVRPPRLGGNERRGVFATRSPFRPNPIGLSSVKLERVEYEEGRGNVLVVTGADLLDGTPIYDIKPYLAYTDSHPDALGGFAAEVFAHALEVEFPPELLERIPEQKRAALCEILSQDPRPGVNREPGRVYGFEFAGLEVKFVVDGEKLTVCDVI